MTDVAKLCAAVLMAYGFVFLVTFLWHLIAAPPNLASEQAATISDLGEKMQTAQQNASATADKRQRRIRFAKLMEEGATLELKMRTIQDNAGFSSFMPGLAQWIADIVTALTDSGMETESSGFLRSGEAPSISDLSRYEHVPTWKRHVMAQLMLYRDKLQEIVTRNSL